MPFVSPIFFIFALPVIAVNYFLGGKARLLWQLAASIVFIAYFNVESAVVVLLSSSVNYFIGRRVEKNRSRVLYYSGLMLNCGAILLFNCFSSAGGKVEFGFSMAHFNAAGFILALGLSFYSLQHIAYLRDVYTGNIPAEKNLLHFLLFSAFFPKISSGPVTLARDLVPQFSKQYISQQELVSGFHRFLLGLFKKMVIADRLAPSVHSIFDFGEYPGATILAAALLFTVQLYFDFSAYSDMALGTARMMGYKLKENFNLPFRSTSIGEFWRRWHMSLIDFFTNYVYYPLAFRLRKHKKTGAIAGIWLTFLLSALWHGIGFTFLCWALCHIIYLCFELLTKKRRNKFSKIIPGKIYIALSITFTLLLVSFSNIFFRAGSFRSALHMMRSLFCDFFPKDMLVNFVAPLAVGGQQLELFNLIITLFILVLFLLFEKKINRLTGSESIKPVYLFGLVLLIFLWGVFSNTERFIYMQF